MQVRRAISWMLVPAFFAGLLLYWKEFPPRDPIDSADGIYGSDCCGSFSLHRGVLRFGTQQVPYVVEHDKAGRYILPKVYVGVFDGSQLWSDASKYPLKLRINDGAMPKSIELTGKDNEAYDFTSQSREKH